jgi:crossover junction endodeoxyribonuclease RuvC
MLTIGVDPGTATTGYGLVRMTEEGELALVDYGAIATTPDQDMPERLRRLHAALTEIVLLHRPDESAVEKLFFQRNVSTALSVGQARGVALLALAEQGVPVAEYSPLEVKQAIVGYGSAAKRQVQQMVKVLLHMDNIPQPDDAADALAVAICHLHSRGLRQRAEVSG